MEGATGAATALAWCSKCGQRLETRGDGPLAKAVHQRTGDERGAPDGHIAAPIDFEPQIWKDARELRSLYGGVFLVTGRLGILRADWADPPAGAVVEHYTGRTREELEAKLDAAIGGLR